MGNSMSIDVAGAAQEDETMQNPYIKLHTGNMGAGATEQDYVNWIYYVCANIDQESGLDVMVECENFGVCLSRDVVKASCDEDISALRAALEQLWDNFCAAGWPAPVAAG